MFAPADKQARTERAVFLATRQGKQVVGDPWPFARDRLPNLLLQASYHRRQSARMRTKDTAPTDGSASAADRAAAGKPSSGANRENAPRQQ